MNYPNEETFENSKSNNQGNSKAERAEDDYKEPDKEENFELEFQKNQTKKRILNLNFKKVNSTEHFQKCSVMLTVATK